MRIANPFRYQFDEPYPSSGSIIKLHFGKKYFILKTKALQQAVNRVAVELDQRMRLGLKPGDIYEKVVKHIHAGRVTMMRVEALLLSDDPAQLLITEHKLLKEAAKDDLCLNTTFFPMIPKWIPETAVAEFNKHLTKLKAAAKKKPKAAGKKKKVGKRPVAKKSRITKRKKPTRNKTAGVKENHKKGIYANTGDCGS